MRTYLLNMGLLAGLVGVAGCTVAGPAQSAPVVIRPTIVFIVRHAEKASPAAPDLPLSAAGEQRALTLRDTLARFPVAAIYSTNTGRTRATAQPTAQARELPPIIYDAGQLPALAARIRRQYRIGQTVLIVGHSNTILETVEAFGVPRPVPSVGDQEYSYLLQVTLPVDSTRGATVVARRYGMR